MQGAGEWSSAKNRSDVMSLNGTLPTQGAGRQPVLAGNVHDVSGDKSRAKMATTVALLIDEPNCRFLVEPDS